MLGSCYINRRRDYTIRQTGGEQCSLDHPKLEAHDHLDFADSFDEEEQFSLSSPGSRTFRTHQPPKERSCCGTIVRTPNSSRFANNWHSRFLQKYPFLVEMFYWAINFVTYAGCKAFGEVLFSHDGVWELSKTHGIFVLWLEHESFFSWLFPLREVDVQQFFMNHHADLLTFLNRMYSVVHIPATVSFISWYYYAAPTHDHFVTMRRMMTLTNFLSFGIFTAWPCMPPRLLPEEFGFFDTVRRDSAQSVWASGKFFNQLAAFPSLHFGYSFCVGVTLVYHSGIFRRRLGRREKRMGKLWQIAYVLLGVLYPVFVLTIIVATANHYWFDAMAGGIVVGIAFLCNRIFLALLPLEDIFLWCVRLEKPVPTTGIRG
jgi:PAP2 superfamily protein